MSEEDQMMRAIAMSLGQEVTMEQRSDSPEVNELKLLKTLWALNCLNFQNLIFKFISPCLRKQHVDAKRRTGDQGSEQKRRRPAAWKDLWRQSH